MKLDGKFAIILTEKWLPGTLVSDSGTGHYFKVGDVVQISRHDHDDVYLVEGIPRDDSGSSLLNQVVPLSEMRILR